MTHAHRVTSLLISAVLFSACGKDSTTHYGPSSTSALASLRALFEDNVQQATQTFTVPASTGGVFVGVHGTTIQLQGGAFVNASGLPVTGNVTVYLVEALTLGDMVRLNKQTVANDNGTMRYLTTGGAYSLSATQNGQPLQLVPGHLAVTVPYVSAPDPSMDLFSGQEDSEGRMVWTMLPEPQQTLQLDTMGYTFTNDSLTWTNCDYFANFPGALTDVTLTTPTGFPSEACMVFAVFPDQRVVANVPRYPDGTFRLEGSYQVPVGIPIHFAGLHIAADSSLYTAIISTNTTPNMQVDLTFTQTTLQAFEQMVAQW